MTAAGDVEVVIVTYNSGSIVRRVVDALHQGTLTPSRVVMVDNGSTDPESLAALEESERHPAVVVDRMPDNRGFCAGNNIGLATADRSQYVLLLNPDAVVSERFLEDAVALLESDPSIGAMNPLLLTLDRSTQRPTGRIDCAGIFLTGYGRIYDRGQGEVHEGQYGSTVADVPALCAAAMLCRRSALESVADSHQVFDEDFFMYKEDIDLSLRLRAAGWRVVLDPSAVVYHCRGTDQQDRSSTPMWVRRRSIANEWRIWRKKTLPARVRLLMFGYLSVKSLAVRMGI